MPQSFIGPSSPYLQRRRYRPRHDVMGLTPEAEAELQRQALDEWQRQQPTRLGGEAPRGQRGWSAKFTEGLGELIGIIEPYSPADISAGVGGVLAGRGLGALRTARAMAKIPDYARLRALEESPGEAALEATRNYIIKTPASQRSAQELMGPAEPVLRAQLGEAYGPGVRRATRQDLSALSAAQGQPGRTPLGSTVPAPTDKLEFEGPRGPYKRGPRGPYKKGPRGPTQLELEETIKARQLKDAETQRFVDEWAARDAKSAELRRLQAETQTAPPTIEYPKPSPQGTGTTKGAKALSPKAKGASAMKPQTPGSAYARVKAPVPFTTAKTPDARLQPIRDYLKETFSWDDDDTNKWLETAPPEKWDAITSGFKDKLRAGAVPEEQIEGVKQLITVIEVLKIKLGK